MSQSWPPAVRVLVRDVVSVLAGTLGDSLVGIYLYGSLVTGDFDATVSDLDLLAVTEATLDPDEFARLDVAHTEITARHPAWLDRIEIAYLGVAALETFRTQRSPIAVISPGEPFNVKDAGADWLINWYTVRNSAVTLIGPSPTSFIADITPSELREAVRREAQQWRHRDFTGTHPGFQAYAILTACRALYTSAHGTLVSKIQAARWVRDELPHWAELIDQAVMLRSLGGYVGEAEPARTAKFVSDIADRVDALHRAAASRGPGAQA